MDLDLDLYPHKRRALELAIISYIFDNAGSNLKGWKKDEKKLIKKGILTKKGVLNDDYMPYIMKDAREIIIEKGHWEGRKKGIKEGIEKGRKEGIKLGIEKVQKKTYFKTT